MTPDETRLASAAAYFGAHGVERATISYSAGDAMLSVADRPAFFAKLRDGVCVFTDDARGSGWIEVANRRVYFSADAGVLIVRATNEPELGRATAKLKKGGERAEVHRRAAIAAATERQQRWVKRG